MDQLAEDRGPVQAAAPIPSGTVTFLFTDIEGSTERWETHRAAMGKALARHDELLSEAIVAHGGYIFKKMGDAHCAAFRTSPDAVAAALAAQRALRQADFASVDDLRVRMALHTGYSEERDSDYFGPTVNRVARLLAIAHGGQVLLSAAAADLSEGDLPPHTTMRSLGRHRLKDLAHPENVFQLVSTDLPADFPPLRSLDSLPNNLPLQVTSFLGRDGDVAEVKTLLTRTRLLTLTGTGGVGKTRLALQAGAELLDQHPDGVWFIDLAGLQDAELVVSETATVLGVRAGSDRSLTDSLVYALKPKRTLIIFDNCEHVVAAAALLVSSIMKGAPHVRAIATSREALGIAGEVVHRVNTLAIPPAGADLSPEAALQHSAVALFVDRASAANTRFTLSAREAPIVADICRSLDGIPFAIELAAARVKVMSVAHLQERLTERFRILTGGDRTALPRQQTMRALVDWSYNLLGERERTIFNRVAVFAGGWTLEAAAEVCSDESIESWEILDLISSLVDKSLVVVELADKNERYRLLDSTWQYALEKLDETGEAERISRRHAEYFLRLAQAADKVWQVTPTDTWVAALRPEVDNFRAALGWALTKKHDVQLGAAMEALLTELWFYTGLLSEGRRWTQLALDVLRDAPPSSVTAALFLGVCRTASLAGVGGNLEAAHAAIAHAEATGDEAMRAEARLALGFALDRAGRLDEGVEQYVKALPALKRLGHKKQVARCLSWWATTHFVRGEPEAAKQKFAEALTLAKGLADTEITNLVLSNLAELAFQQGQIDKAIAHSEEVLESRRSTATTIGNASSWANLAAYRLAGGDLAGCRLAAKRAFEVGRQHETTILIAFTIQHLCVIAARESKAALAARLLGYVEKVMLAAEFYREPTEQWSYGELMKALRASLSDDEIAALGSEGAAWNEEQAIEAALTI